MQTERLGLRSRIEKKAVYLQELEEQVWIAIFYPFMLWNFCPVPLHVAWFRSIIVKIGLNLLYMVVSMMSAHTDLSLGSVCRSSKPDTTKWAIILLWRCSQWGCVFTFHSCAGMSIFLHHSLHSENRSERKYIEVHDKIRVQTCCSYT